ncbi:hypothetical protein D9758_004350 [Tetrapyrgos nigripes]|uniref:Uncharacterized protein n=1 Tax=Tetrapyrgos nigripes TaxID=182062 RepID=A0A8H5LSM8_9AGAR|nr:hypothetical protein D9758_004350 [Tetrapyrgos nigripes]
MTSMDNSPQRPVWPIRIRSWINQLFINRYSSWDDRIVAQQIKVALESWNGAVYGWDIARDDSREECLRYVVDSLSQDIIIFGVVLAYRLRDSPHAQQYSRLILMVGSILTSYWGPECALVGPDTIPPSVDDFSGGFMVWTNVLADFVLSSPTPPAQHTSQHPSYPHTGEDTGHNFFVSSQAHHTPANRNTTNSSLAAPATVNGGALNTTHPQNTSYPYQTPPYPAPNTSYPTPPYNYPSQYSSYPTPPYPVQNTSYSYPTPPYPPSHAPHLPQTPPRPPENAPQPPQTVPPPTQTAPPPPQNISYPTPPYLPQNTSWPFQTPPYPPPNVPYPTPPYPPQNTSWPVQTPQYPPPNVLQPPLNVPQQPQTAPPPHQAAPPSQPDSAPSIQTPHHRPVTPYPSAPAQVDSDAANNEAAVDVDVDLEITEEEVFIPVIPGVAGLGNEPVRTGGSAAAGAGAGGLVSRGGGGEVGDSSGGAVNAGGGEAGNDDDANNGPRPPRLQWHPFLAPPMYPIPYDQPHPHGVLIPNIPMTLNPDPRLPPGPTLESGTFPPVPLGTPSLSVYILTCFIIPPNPNSPCYNGTLLNSPSMQRC